MAELKFQFFGTPCFTLNGASIRVGRRKAVALAAFLVVTGKKHSRERLADLFWPEYDRERARSSLRRTLSVMTKALGKFWLSIGRESIGFVSHGDLQVDVIRFRKLTTLPLSGPGSVVDLEEAAGLYDNSFLAGFTLGDCPDFDDWQLEQTEGFCREAVKVMQHLSGWYMERRDYPRAICHARSWAGLEPLNETAHRQLIRLYHQAGHRELALGQYEKCKSLLRKELGVEPDQRTLALASAMRTEPAATTQKNAPPLTNLPTFSTGFVGRKQELRSLKKRLTRSGVRLLTLTGPGGMGKTRLALEAAAVMETAPDVRDQFPQGVFFLSASDLSSTEAVVTALLKTFRLSFDEERYPFRRLMAFLKPAKCLVVLDNLEHLPEVGALVSQMLAQAPGLKILATSRSRLMLKGEHLLSLSGLCYPELPLTETDRAAIVKREETYDAVALFLGTARMVQPNVKLNSTNVHEIARICALTQGMPLALILAAGWMEIFPPEKIAIEIGNSLDFLKTELRDLPPCHQSIRAVFDASWNRLPKAEREIFVKLSVFRDGFTMAAAADVMGTARDFAVLMGARLVRKSMLKVNPETGRFEFHPLLRQYAREKLVRLGLLDEMMDAHGYYYLVRAYESEKQLIGAEMLACRQEMDADLANIRQAWLRAVEQKDFAALARAATGLYVYFDMHTRYHEGEDLFRPAKEMLMKAWNPGMYPGAGVILLCWFDMQAQALPPQEQPISSVEAVEEIMEMARGLLRGAVKRANAQARAFALLTMGAIAHRQERYQRAIRFYRLSLEQDSRIEHAFWVYMRIGLCWQSLGEIERAVRRFRQSHGVGDRLGDAIKQAWSLHNIGAAELCMGNLETAESLLQQALTVFEQINAPIGMVFSREELGWIAFLRGDFTRAVFLADQALEISTDFCFALSRYQKVQALKGLALVVLGRQTQAQSCLEKVLKTGLSCFTAHLGMAFLSYIRGKRSATEYHLKSAAKNASSEQKPQLKLLLMLASAAAARLSGENRRAAVLLNHVLHHPHCPVGLFKSWDLPGILAAGLKIKDQI